MVDSFRLSQSEAIKAETQRIQEYAQQAGRSMDDPSIQGMLFQLKQNSLAQVGNVSNKAWTEFNTSKLEARQNYSQMRSTMEGSFAQAHAYGLQSVAEAGRTFSTTVSDVQHWAESGKNDAISLWNTANLEVGKLELLGDNATADAYRWATEMDQWVPEFGLVSTLVGTQNSFQQQDFQNTMQVVSMILGAIPALSQTFFPGRYMPSTPSSSSGLAGMFGSAGMTSSATLGSAFILK